MKSKRRTGGLNLAIAELAERQHGVVSRRQLRALGLSEAAITARAHSGGLHPLFRGTFAVGHRGVGRHGRLLAAVLASGEGTVLSHGSAAELLGLWDKQPDVIDVIAPRRAGRKIEGIRWHNVLRPLTAEVEVCDGVPCTTVSRTLVDIAGRTGPVTLRRLIAQAAVLRQLDVSDVDRILARGRRRGAPWLRIALEPWRTDDEWKPRLRSPLEATLLPALLAAGIPRPRCNARTQIDREWIEIDLLWEEHRLAIETDGEETHGTRGAFHSDRRRDQLLLANGYRVARVSWRQAEHETAAVVKRIKRMLEAQ